MVTGCARSWGFCSCESLTQFRRSRRRYTRASRSLSAPSRIWHKLGGQPIATARFLFFHNMCRRQGHWVWDSRALRCRLLSRKNSMIFQMSSGANLLSKAGMSVPFRPLVMVRKSISSVGL